MHKLNTALLRAFLLLGGMLPLLTGCKAVRNALTPLKTNVTITDTIYLPEVKVDTVAITLPVDTIVIETERVSARVIRSYDTISVEAQCKTDTVVLTREVTIPAKTVVVRKPPLWFKPFLVVLAFFVVVLLGAFTRR